MASSRSVLTDAASICLMQASYVQLLTMVVTVSEDAFGMC